MLILSRRVGEVLEIHLPQGVARIRVLKIDPWEGFHKFGIEAPKNVMILREELKGKQLYFAKDNRPGKPIKSD